MPILKVWTLLGPLPHREWGRPARDYLGIAVVVPEEGNTDRLVLLAIYDPGKPDPHSLDRKLTDHCYSRLLACDGQKSNRATVRLRAGP